MLEISKENLKEYKNISYIEAGIGSDDKELRFASKNSIGGGTISEIGEEVIKIVKIDSVKMDNAPSFIKMDIEGAEI